MAVSERMAVHVCSVEHDAAMASILDYVEQFIVEKMRGEHTNDNPCSKCKVGRDGKINYQPPSSGWITPERRDAIRNLFGYRCVWCRADLSKRDKSDQTLDHLVTLEQYEHLPTEIKIWFGSKHKTSNLVLACKSCNSARKNETFCSWAKKNKRVKRIGVVLSNRAELNITDSKARVGNNRRTYKNAWVTRQRLSQGIGT